jgi:hypothetical protein
MIDSAPDESPYPRNERRAGDASTTLEPFDFGEAPETVLRALERNRRLLYETPSEVQCDRRAVRQKIDELLDRLLEANYVQPREKGAEAPQSNSPRRRPRT